MQNSSVPTFLWAPIDATVFPQKSVAPRVAQRQIDGLRNLDATPRYVTAAVDPEVITVITYINTYAQHMHAFMHATLCLVGFSDMVEPATCYAMHT